MSAMRFKVMLPENYVVVTAGTEEEAKAIALDRFKNVGTDDLIAWEEPAK